MIVRFLARLLIVTIAALCGQTSILGQVGMQSPAISHPDYHKPDFPPSYILHISPSQIKGTGNYGGMDFWSLQGFDIKGVIGILYDLNRIRIELPASLDDGVRYDFSMVLPGSESRQRITELFRKGIQDHFQLAVTRKDRLMDVYVVTASDREPPAIKAQPTEGGTIYGTNIGFEAPENTGDPPEFAAVPRSFSITAVDSISMEGTTDGFCHLLESQLDRPVVNETHLKGEFAFQILPSQSAKNDFLDRLRDRLGLVITPTRRNVEILVFKVR